MITCSSHCMELNDDMRKLMQQLDNKTAEIQKRFQEHKYPHLKGKIVIADQPIAGYGNASFIKSLNDTNILTQPEETLVRASFNVHDTKNNKDAITDWTKEVPAIIMAETYELADTLKKNVEEYEDLRIVEPLNRRIDDECKKIQKTLPTHLPASLLLKPKVKLNLFGVYQTELKVKNHKSLQQNLLSSYNRPAVITEFTPKTKKELQRIQWSNIDTGRKRIKNSKKLLIERLQQAVEELEANDTVKYVDPEVKNVKIINNSSLVAYGSLATRAILTGYNNTNSKIGH